MLQRLKRDESGQSIVLIAMAMVAIIAMAALVLDGGYGYLERRRVPLARETTGAPSAERSRSMRSLMASRVPSTTSRPTLWPRTTASSTRPTRSR
jgi:hypothetical protein